MFGFPDFKIGAAGNSAAGINQIGRFQNFGAVFTLVAAGFFIAAIRTGAGYVAIRQKTPVINRIKLFDGTFFDIAVFIKLFKNVISHLLILFA